MSTNYNTILNEELDLSGYSDEDFMEVFVEYFRPWIKKTHGGEVGKYPMSLLVKKYLEEFSQDYELNVYFGYGNVLSKMVKVGTALAQKGVRELPSLNRGVLFTEKFKRSIDHFISAYNFPDFVKLRFEENSPFNVYGYLEIEFEPAMKYEGKLNDIVNFGTEFIRFIKSYLGFEIGSTAHGKLNINMGTPRFVGQEEWIKNFFNKIFKKEIKKSPRTQSYLHSVKLEIQAYQGVYSKIILTFKRSTSWTTENAIVEDIKGYLQGLGYNTNNLRVEKK
jgi:hypothetical protein